MYKRQAGLAGLAGVGALAGLIGLVAGFADAGVTVGAVGIPPRGAPPPVDGVAGVLMPEEERGVVFAEGRFIGRSPRTPCVRFCGFNGEDGFLGSVLGVEGVVIPELVLVSLSTFGNSCVLDVFVSGFVILGV